MASPPASDLPRAFVTGVTGQDGYYLARLLLSRGREVVGGVRRPDSPAVATLRADLPGLRLLDFDLLSTESVESALVEANPAEIYHLAGVSHVPASWRDPATTLEVNTLGALRVLDVMRGRLRAAHLVFAGSGDCFDHAAAPARGLSPATPLRCTNPYSIAKAAAMQLVQAYRAQHGLRASVAILMNHTSPRRAAWFVERKIVHEAAEVAAGRRARVTVGSLETARDWSWAEDIVEALAALGGRDEAGDFVLASGRLRTTGDWVRAVFDRLKLDPQRHLEIDPTQLHAGDRPHTFGDVGPARQALGWAPRTDFATMVDRLLAAERASLSPTG